MAYEVLAESVGPRTLAAVRATTDRRQLGRDIVRLLDIAWPLLREQGVRTGHNVVVYYDAASEEFPVDVGVETLTDFADGGQVRHASTPAGDVATTAHCGEYSEIAPAYSALTEWCISNGRERAGVNWEVYGDWDEDPAKRRTDVYFLLKR